MTPLPAGELGVDINLYEWLVRFWQALKSGNWQAIGGTISAIATAIGAAFYNWNRGRRQQEITESVKTRQQLSVAKFYKEAVGDLHTRLDLLMGRFNTLYQDHLDARSRIHGLELSEKNLEVTIDSMRYLNETLSQRIEELYAENTQLKQHIATLEHNHNAVISAARTCEEAKVCPVLEPQQDFDPMKLHDDSSGEK